MSSIFQADSAITSLGGAGAFLEMDARSRVLGTVQVTGTWTGNLVLQGSVSSDVWVTVGGQPFINVATRALSGSITASGTYQFDTSGFTKVRVTATALTGSVQASITVTPFSLAPTVGAALVRTGINAAFPDGSRVSLPMTSGGAVIVQQLSPLELTQTYAPPLGGVLNSTAPVTLFAAAGAGVRNYLSNLVFSSQEASATTELVIRDGAGGPVLFRSVIVKKESDPTAVSFNPPLRGSANTLMEFALLTAVNGAVYLNASGFRGV